MTIGTIIFLIAIPVALVGGFVQRRKVSKKTVGWK